MIIKPQAIGGVARLKSSGLSKRSCETNGTSGSMLKMMGSSFHPTNPLHISSGPAIENPVSQTLDPASFFGTRSSTGAMFNAHSQRNSNPGASKTQQKIPIVNQ